MHEQQKIKLHTGKKKELNVIRILNVLFPFFLPSILYDLNFCNIYAILTKIIKLYSRETKPIIDSPGY